MLKQKVIFENGNNIIAIACSQMAYNMICNTYSNFSIKIYKKLKEIAKTKHLNIALKEDAKSALGFCYGFSISSGRAVCAISFCDFLNCIEQAFLQARTNFPLVLNICFDSMHKKEGDITYLLNCGIIVLFAKDVQEIYDFNIIALKLSEKLNLPIAIIFEDFFASEQYKKCYIFEKDEDILNFLSLCDKRDSILDTDKLLAINSLKKEEDFFYTNIILNEKMLEGKKYLYKFFNEFYQFSGRKYAEIEKYLAKDSDVLLFLLGGNFEIAKEAVDILRKDSKKVGIFTLKVLSPCFLEQIGEICQNTKVLICLDKQNNIGSSDSNLSLKIKAVLQERGLNTKVITRIYKALNTKDIIDVFNESFMYIDGKEIKAFDYLNYNFYKKEKEIFNKIKKSEENNEILDKKFIKGHNACPGCSIPTNLNLFFSCIDSDIVMLLQNGCAMYVSTNYPKTSIKINCIHNFSQNSPSIIAGISEMFEQKKKLNQVKKDITFVMVTGDGGFDSCFSDIMFSALKKYKFIILEYDNLGSMNTGELEKEEFLNRAFFYKDNIQILKKLDLPYLASVCEGYKDDFIQKVKKAMQYSKKGVCYIKALSFCPKNWCVDTKYAIENMQIAVKSCFYPLYEIEEGKTKITYNPEEKEEKESIESWLSKIEIAKDIDNQNILNIQKQVDKKWEKLKQSI